MDGNPILTDKTIQYNKVTSWEQPNLTYTLLAHIASHPDFFFWKNCPCARHPGWRARERFQFWCHSWKFVDVITQANTKHGLDQFLIIFLKFGLILLDGGPVECCVFVSCCSQNEPSLALMATLFLQTRQATEQPNLTYTLLAHIASHPDFFSEKIAHAPDTLDGGPEKDSNCGVLSSINPKFSTTKEKRWHAF